MGVNARLWCKTVIFHIGFHTFLQYRLVCAMLATPVLTPFSHPLRPSRSNISAVPFCARHDCLRETRVKVGFSPLHQERRRVRSARSALSIRREGVAPARGMQFVPLARDGFCNGGGNSRLRTPLSVRTERRTPDSEARCEGGI